MKNIAIITATRDLYNYGQILQAYALCTYLNNNGHNASLIDFAYDIDWLTIPPIPLVNRLKYLIKISPIYNFLQRKKDLCRFLDFKKRHFVKYPKTYASFSSLRKKPPIADIYITGSDQIWGPHTPRLEPFFLDFGASDIKRVAYAPSFGSSAISSERAEIIKPLIAKYSAVGVREFSGRDIARTLGFGNSEWVPDPTLLLERREWLKIASPVSPFKREDKLKIFVYIIGKDNDTRILDFANSIDNAEIIVASDHPTLPAEKQYLTIPEWIKAFEDCDYVVTNSFHGTMFSLIFRKPFVTFERIGAASHMNVRVQSIIKIMNLPSRLISSEINPTVEMIKEPIDCESFNMAINNWRQVGIDFLNKNI